VNYADLKLQFHESAALRLLRADTAPFALAVLFTAFKRDNVPSVNESRLRAILEAELGELRDVEESDSTREPKTTSMSGAINPMGIFGDINLMVKTNQFVS